MAEIINTFENGMDKDSAIGFQPQGTYRDMYNGMLVSYDGNHYVVETAQGNQISFTIPSRYKDIFSIHDAPPMPIGLISFADTLVVHSTNDTSLNGGYGEIGIVSFDKDGIGTYKAIYNHVDLKYSRQYKIEGFSYEENDGIKRVYWTDNFNQGRLINTKDAAFTAVPSGSIVSGTTYMVTGGAITYNGINFGPGLIAGNIFTGTATTIFALLADSPIVTQYIPLALLSFTPDRNPSLVTFKKWSAGSLYAGKKCYVTRLGQKSDGYYTAWSYITHPMAVYADSVFSGWSNVSGAGSSGLVNTGKAIELSVDNIDQNFDILEVAAIEYDQSLDVIRKISVIYSGGITGTSMTVVHYGTENIKDLTIDDITLFPASILKWKTMTTSKNYNIIGNITERPEIDYTPNGIATLEPFDYWIPSDQSTLANMNQGMSIASSVIASGGIVPDGRYKVTGGTIMYNGVTYGTGAVAGIYFIGVTGVYNYAIVTPTPVITACILLKKYKTNTGSYSYKDIPITDDFYDYKGMAVSQYLSSYWYDETYRLAFLGFDLKGIPFYSRWIDDIRMPDQITKGGMIQTHTGEKTSIRAQGIKVRNLAIPSDIMAQMSGFSIVRAPRDKRIFGQGLIWPLVGDGAFIRPQSTPAPANDNYYAAGDYVGSATYIWLSGEQLFNFTGAGMTNANKMEMAYYYSARQAEYGSSGLTEQIFTKFYDPANTSAFTKQLLNITDFEGFGVGAIITNANGSGRSFNCGNVKAAGFAASIPSCEGVGSTGTLVGFSGSLFYNGQVIDGARSYPLNYDTAKPLMNYIKEKTVYYGGTSKDALSKTVYISTGHFQEINATIMAETFDSGSGKYIFDEIEVMGGDCYPTILDVARTMFNEGYSISYSHAIFFPLESHVNTCLREGRRPSKDGMHANTNGVWYQKGGTENDEDFIYNQAYSSTGSPVSYPALPVANLSNGRQPYRVRWAGAKILGELSDSFRTFKTNNYRDVDGQRGEINNLRSKDGRLYYWQQKAIGYLPILERQVVNSSAGSPTQLGIGGVIDRFDEISTFFGNTHQHGMTETEYGFCWFDMRRRSLLIMSAGGGIEEISITKGLQAFFNSAFNPYFEVDTDYQIFNIDKPLMGTGIIGVYDPRFKMTFITFKYRARNQDDTIIYQDFTIGYHHVRNVIVGFFDFVPGIWHLHNNLVISAKDCKGVNVEALSSYAVGQIAELNGTEYICYNPYTTSNPIVPSELPDFPGSPYWKNVITNADVHKNWDSDICNFYGLVYPFSLEMVVNPKVFNPITIDNIELKSNEINFDSIYYSNDNDSAQDVNIKSYDRNFRYQDRIWRSSIALGTKGRLVDMYLKVKFVLNNYTTTRVVSNNKQKIVEYVKSFYRIKR